MRLFALVLAQRRHRDHVALVRPPGEHTAIKRFDSLGVGDAGVQPAGNIHGDVMAAQREAFQMNEPAVYEGRHRGGAGAHIDDGGAEIGLVVGENGEPCDIGRRDHGLDVEVAALDRKHQIARRGDVGGGDMHVDAEPRAEHAARIADAVDAVDRVTDRQRMKDGAAVAQRVMAAGGKDARNVALGDGGADHFDVGREQFAGQPARRYRKHNGFDLDRRHALRAVDGLANGFLGEREIDDTSRLHAARDGMAEPDDLDGMTAAG